MSPPERILNEGTRARRFRNAPPVRGSANRLPSCDHLRHSLSWSHLHRGSFPDVSIFDTPPWPSPQAYVCCVRCVAVQLGFLIRPRRYPADTPGRRSLSTASTSSKNSHGSSPKRITVMQYHRVRPGATASHKPLSELLLSLRAVGEH